MTDSTITINLSRPTELEFDMTTNGLHKDGDIPIVRFMLIDSTTEISYVFPCTKKTKKRWIAKIPKLNITPKNEYTFCIECIIDGYYFVPAEGTVNLTDKLTATLTSKPEKIEEGALGADITGQYAPTNGLLKPEKEPTPKSSAKTPKTEPYDELIDREELGLDDFTPGRGGKQYAQEDGKDIDPRELVDELIHRNKPQPETDPTDIETNEKPTHKKGSLFTRDPDGKAFIPGLETDEQKEKIAALNKKLRDMLN